MSAIEALSTDQLVFHSWPDPYGECYRVRLFAPPSPAALRRGDAASVRSLHHQLCRSPLQAVR